MTETLPPELLLADLKPAIELVISEDGTVDFYIHDQATLDFYTLLALREGMDLDAYIRRWVKKTKMDVRAGRPVKLPHE